MSETAVLERPGEQLAADVAYVTAAEAAALEALYSLPVATHETQAGIPVAQEDDQIAASRKRVEGETYSHSTLLIKRIGELAMRGELETKEGQAALRYLRESWESSLVEMLQTDPDFRDPNKVILEITRRRTTYIVNGRWLASDGVTDMQTVALDGEQSALIEAETDERMVPPAIRAGADRRVADKVPGLKPEGESLLSWTVYPDEAMQQYGQEFYESLGFRKGLSFAQGYCRVGDTVETFFYSVDFIDPELIRELWAEEGHQIPASEFTNTWLDYQKTFMGTPDELDAFIENLRTRLYKKANITAQRYSMDQFIADNKDVCDQMFAVYLDLTAARETGQKTKFLQAFVNGLLEDTRHLHPNLHIQLREIQAKDKLHKEDVARLEELNRYATVEHLRDALAFLGSSKPARVETIMAPDGIGMSQQEYLARSLAGKVHNGLRHFRTYGGCTRSSDLFRTDPNDDDAGSDKATNDEDKRDDDVLQEQQAEQQACDYKITTCYCCPYDHLGRPLDAPMEVTVRRGRNGIARCLRGGCGAALSGTGKVLSKGWIHAAAEGRKVAATKKKGELALAA